MVHDELDIEPGQIRLKLAEVMAVTTGYAIFIGS